MRKLNIKKLILFSGMSLISVATFSAVACSVNQTPEDIRLTLTGKGTDISEKTLENKKTIVQLKTVGYEQFTFSDYWWSLQDNLSVKYHSEHYGIDIEREQDVQSKNNSQNDSEDIFFKKEKTENLKKNISDSSVLDTSIRMDDQKDTDKQFKSISLVTDEETLKTQLRISDKQNERFYTFARTKIDSNIKDEDIENLKPWNSHFSYEAIKSKLDLEKNNYLFVKDFTNFIVRGENVNWEKELIYNKVDKGIHVSDYRIDKDKKEFYLFLKYSNPPTKEPDRYAARPTMVLRSVFIGPKGLTSFLLPVDKDEISDFDLNEWKIFVYGYRFHIL
ncbi:hypothetical protein [Mycoplasmopsis agassizii]|uniref:Lipoprotein n=1 Tax=Mycoplasmopsis agassizii TaxID=33922 RepID=A0ABX4H6L3_9BACT|nr:hypothetical protein [Mycoplasmopsis agassizii]PAF55536.1 hypothetical protein CJF60_02565 [Mycoplasmopsis agassizii]SMC17930.1 hypothetical protein SAMN02745179_00557 [Mycoplasmopsis agassizii]